MEESELIEQIKKAWGSLQKHMDTFYLYTDMVKPDMSGFKESDEIDNDNNENVQFKEGMTHFFKGYSHAIKLEFLCDLYIAKNEFKNDCEHFVAAKQLAADYASYVESKMMKLFALIDKDIKLKKELSKKIKSI